VGEPLAADGGDAEAVLQAFADAGLDTDALAARLQQEGAESFSTSWRALLARIEDKQARLAGVNE
jgi:transaldolase